MENKKKKEKKLMGTISDLPIYSSEGVIFMGHEDTAVYFKDADKTYGRIGSSLGGTIEVTITGRDGKDIRVHIRATDLWNSVVASLGMEDYKAN